MRRKLLATCVVLSGICFQSSCTVTGANSSNGLLGGFPNSFAGGSVMPNVPNYGTQLTQTAPPSAFTGGRGGGTAGGFAFSFGSP